jgi:hypothetical protein
LRALNGLHRCSSGLTPRKCPVLAYSDAMDLNASFQFTGRQQLIHGSLAQKSDEIADLYESALRVRWDEGNCGRFLLAAHAIREMTNNLPKVLDLPVETGRLGDQVDALEKVWDRTTKSTCHQQGEWTGVIDDLLRNLLGKIHGLFEWRRKNRQDRRLVVAKMFRKIDPSGQSLPETLEEKRTDSWLDLHDYFVSVTHGKTTTTEEFAGKLESLEKILIDILYPTPSVDISAIDRILEEG